MIDICDTSPPRITLFGAVVDSLNEIITLQDTLQISDNCPILGFENTDQFINFISVFEIRTKVPIVVIADYEGLDQEGFPNLFRKINDIAPFCKKVAYSTNPDDHKWHNLLRDQIITKDCMINKSLPDSHEQLENIVREIFNKFTTSDLYKVVVNYEKHLLDKHLTDRHYWDLLGEVIKGRRSIECLHCDRYCPDLSEQESNNPLNEQPSIPNVDSNMALAYNKVDCNNSKVDDMSINEVEDLIKPNTWLFRLMQRDDLNFLSRLFVEQAACSLFALLQQKSQIARLKEIKKFLESSDLPDKKLGWSIWRDVISRFVN